MNTCRVCGEAITPDNAEWCRECCEEHMHSGWTMPIVGQRVVTPELNEHYASPESQEWQNAPSGAPRCLLCGRQTQGETSAERIADQYAHLAECHPDASHQTLPAENQR